MMISKRNLVLLASLCALALVGLLAGADPIVAAPPSATGAWWGDYFANAALSGSPALSRYDDAINFNWGAGSPGSGIPADNFSVRWVRDEWFAGGTYHFTVVSDDGVRVWVGGQLVVDDWRDRQGTPLYVNQHIPAGTHRVQVEYYEHGGGAAISVGWDRLVGGATWRGDYFDNRELKGNPVMARDDGAIDFDWGNGSPDPAIPADDFSVRWTRTLGFSAGAYRFFTSTDDGVRLWVDGGLVVDSWIKQKLPNTHSGDVYLAEGQHTVVVEYFEQGGEAHAHAWWRSQEPFSAWHGEYFDNRTLVGGTALERDDAPNWESVGINFDWGEQSPADWIPDDNFSVRWTRTVNFTPGYYRFVVYADDGVRLWLDQAIIIDQWRDMDYELHYVTHYLQGTHTVELEYYERAGGARVRFWWESDAGAAAPPAAAATPAAAAPAGVTEEAWQDDPWAAAYFDNTELSGKPVLSRIETALDHNWGWGSPGSVVPNDNFSARWTQALPFEGGVYRFTTYTDDGVRLWVDGQLLIDAWQPMRGYRSATIRLSQGSHDVKMEYYELSGVSLAQLTWRRMSR